jgi:hypothetical protein
MHKSRSFKASGKARKKRESQVQVRQAGAQALRVWAECEQRRREHFATK